MAMFSDSVQLRVKITCSGDAAPKKKAALSLHFSTMRPASMASRCPPRPGFAPWFCRDSVIARMTEGGLGKLVAALSR